MDYPPYFSKFLPIPRQFNIYIKGSPAPRNVATKYLNNCTFMALFRAQGGEMYKESPLHGPEIVHLDLAAFPTTLNH